MHNIYALGKDIAHSKSPVMHNALYEAVGLDWNYGVMDCATPEEAREFLASRDFLGLNVTMPYKPLAYEVASVKASTAKLARGANVLAVKDDNLLAFNVDGQGFVTYLESTGFSFAGKNVVVCGTGPTSLATLHAAALAGANSITLIGRNKERAERTITAYLTDFGRLSLAAMGAPASEAHHRSFREAYEEPSFFFGSYQTSTQAITAADLIVDATPCGMHPGDKAPFDTDLLREGHVVFDVVYGHGETALVSAARGAGCQAYDGSGMLVAQAVATAVVLFEVNDVQVSLGTDEMFRIMADAAAFEC
ncbi:MAG: shikimate dehydrogenase [Raoultibacter sp.]